MSDELSNATKLAALEDYNARLLAENVRLSNESATERERCGVLEREVRAKRARIDGSADVFVEPGLDGLTEDGRAEMQRRARLRGDDVRAEQETDRLNALDAAKFGGA